MFRLTADWNPRNARLREIIKKADCFEESISLTLQLHAIVHSSSVSDAPAATYADQIFNGIPEDKYVIMPTVKDVTLAWNIWHIARIEDIVANMLIAEQEQIFDEDWKEKMNVSVTDTGNAMSDAEIIELSKNLDLQSLFEYRNQVGSQTRMIIRGLTVRDMKRKVKKEQIEKIYQTGGVTSQDESVWLLDFWGRKNVAGLLLMPITRHQIVHLNDCAKLKEKLLKTG